MAIKPIIYKWKINLSDLNRDHYATLNLTVAKHPSETLQRMMVRVLVFCINAQERLSFSKGISAAEEPALWAHSLDDRILLWIDIGEPSVERIKKATRMATDVRVYSFNSKSEVWWRQHGKKISGLKVSVFRFEWGDIQALTELVQRTMELSITITGDIAYVATELGEAEVSWIPLQYN